LSVAFLVPLGIAMMVQMASSNTLIQSMVRDELRGRVMAVYTRRGEGPGVSGHNRVRWLPLTLRPLPEGVFCSKDV
jgi:hypothetical protein